MKLAYLAILICATLSTAAPNTVRAQTPSRVGAAQGGASSSSDSAELTAFKAAIRAKYDLKEKAFVTHDAETILTKFYTRDVISVGSPDGIFVGRDQLRPLYQSVVKLGPVKIESIHTFVHGNSGWDWADFHVFPSDPKVKPFTFAILFLWDKINGEWMCKGDFFVPGSLRSGKLEALPPEPGK
jgi:hypothetical protein